MHACTPIRSFWTVLRRPGAIVIPTCPSRWKDSRCHQDGIDSAWVHTRLRTVDKDDTQVVDIRIYDEAERPIADLDGLTVRLLPLSKVQSARGRTDDLFYRPVWRKSVRDAATPGKGRSKDRTLASWLIFADAKGVGVALAQQT